MRLLMVNYEFPPIGGGAGNAHKFLLHQFAGQRDLHIDVLTSGLEPGLIQEDFAPHIRIYKVGLRKKELHFWRKSEVVTWLFKARRVYDNLLIQNSYDLAHTFFAFPSAWLCYRRVKQLPYLISLRGSDVPGYNERLGLEYKLLSGLFRRIWSGAAGVVANSSGLRDLASEFMPALDIKVIPNGVDTGRFFPAAEKPAASPIRLLTVGRLIPRKRTELMLIALKQLRDVGSEATFTIAGEGPESAVLKEKTVDLGLDDQVRFKGVVPADEIPALYRDHDIFVMCSAHEGMSNAMLEALASGLPVVTTACEGAEELISGSGRIVQSNGPADIAEALQELMDSPQQHQAMASAARQRAEEFTWTAVADAYLKEYKRIIGEKIP
jgi:glycosyltransferase involved in cell wall biosynthesis